MNVLYFKWEIQRYVFQYKEGQYYKVIVTEDTLGKPDIYYIRGAACDSKNMGHIGQYVLVSKEAWFDSLTVAEKRAELWNLNAD